MPAVHSSAAVTTLLPILIATAALLTQLALCQTLKPAQCPDKDPESVCNAVLHFRDRIVDQGQYCNGCRNCTGPDVALTAAHSFVWQHYEHPDLLVQFLKCGPYPAVTQRCRDVSGDAGDEDEAAVPAAAAAAAAVFVSPSDSWSPRLRELRCKCPSVNAASSTPLYQLRSWSLQDDQWVYEFVCPRRQCLVADQQQLQQQQKKKQQPHQQPASSLNPASASTLTQSASLASPASSPASSSRQTACAEKRQSEPSGPVSVTFKCTCPPGYHCVIHDVVLKSDDASKGGGGGGGAGGKMAGGSGGGEWQPLVVKYCQRVVMATVNGTEEGGNS